MKAPKGLLDRDGRVGKLTAFLKVDEGKLKEFTYPDPDSLFTETGSVTSACYALTSPGDVIQIAIAANQGTADIIDCYIDGILRASNTVPKTVRVSNVTIKRVVYREWDSKTSKRKRPQMGELVVKERDTSHDVRVSGDENTTSAVGTIVLKCWRKDPVIVGVPHPRVSASDGETPNPVSPPNYESHPDWFAFNKNIPEEGPPPPFEVGFINPTNPHKTKERNGPQERVDEVANRNPLEHTLYAEFHFHLRSTADLTALGFEDVPVHYSTGPPPPKAKRGASKTGKAKEELEPEPESETETQLENQPQTHRDDYASDRPLEITLLEKSMSATKNATDSALTKTPKKSKQELEYRPRTTLDDLFPDPPQAHSESRSQNATSPAIGEIENNSAVIEDDSRIYEEDLLPPNEELSTLTDETLSTYHTNINEKVPFIESLHSSAKTIPPRPFVAGLKQAPAHNSWLERGPAKEVSDSQHDQAVDNNSQFNQDGSLQNSNRPHSSASFSSRDMSLNNHQDEQISNIAGWKYPQTSENEDESNADDSESVNRGCTPNASSELKLNEGNNSEDEEDRRTGNGELRFRFKRSPSHDSQPFTDSTQLAPESEVQEMVKRSKREHFQTPENSFNGSRRGSIYHSKPSPILGSSFYVGPPRSPSVSSPRRAPEVPFKAQDFQLGTGNSLTNNQLERGSPTHQRTRSLSPSESAAARREENSNVRAVQSMSPSTFALASRGRHGPGYLSPAEVDARHNRSSKLRGGNLVAGVSRRAETVPLSRGSDPQSIAMFSNLGREQKKATFEGSSLNQSMQNFASRLSGNASSESTSKNQKEHPMEGTSSQRTPKLELSSHEQIGSALDENVVTHRKIVLSVTPEPTPPKSLSERPIAVPANFTSKINESPLPKAFLTTSQLTQPLSPLNQKRKADMADAPLSDVDEPARKENKPPYQRKTAESVSRKLQGAPTTKRKAEDMGDSAFELNNLTPRKMSASDLAKKSFKNAIAELDKSQSSTSQDLRNVFQSKNPPPIPSKKDVVRQTHKATPDRVLNTVPMTPEEVTMKRKTIQERIAAASKQKETLQKELEDAQTLKKQLNEIREMEKAAEESERENAELQAQIEAIYGAVNEA